MRYESTVTSLSWIPSEAVTGSTRAAFEGGFAHYDDPPPGELATAGAHSVAGLRAADRFRFANVLGAWIETGAAGQITAAGYAADGGGQMGSTTVSLGVAHRTFQAVQLPDLRREPEYGDGWVRFTQTVGGRTGVPAPRRVAHPPYVQWQAPTVWTTLTLTLHADGRAEIGVPGASRFPRHWVYDADGKLARKSGLTDFKEWSRTSFGRHTPWGDEDSPALIVAVESALERSLSVQLMHGAAKPRDQQLPGGRDPGSAGAARVGRLPGPGRRGPHRARWRAAGRLRARRAARRAGPPGRRRPHREPGGRLAVQGRGRGRRAARPVRPGGTVRRSPARGRRRPGP